MTARPRLLTVPLLLVALALSGCAAADPVPDGARRLSLDRISVDVPSDWVEQEVSGDDAETSHAIYRSADGALELRAAAPYQELHSALIATSVPITSLQVGIGRQGFEITETGEPAEGENYANASTVWFSCKEDSTQSVLVGRMTKDTPGTANDEVALITIVGSDDAFEEADVRSIVDSVTVSE
ncbi:hypothetical protein [Microbacterium lacticum]